MFVELRPNLPPAVSRRELGYTGIYSGDEFKRIIAGFDSSGMDEKWDIISDAPWLYFHRSWTGLGCYGVRFDSVGQGATVAESWINSDGHTCDEQSLDYHRKLLGFLIDAFLLRKKAQFPFPPKFRLTGLKRAAYVQVVAGHIPPMIAGE